MARIRQLCLFVIFLLVASMHFRYSNDFAFQTAPVRCQGIYELARRGTVTGDQSKPKVEPNISRVTPGVVEIACASNEEATRHPPPPDVDILIENKNICKNGSRLKYIVYVHSAPENLVRRNALRSSWLNTTFFKEGLMQYAFILGRGNSGTIEAKIKAEAEKYGDIVQGDFMDTYKNLTLKGVLGLKWVATHCKEAQLLLKTDDDAFVNIFMLFTKLRTYEGKKKTIICGLFEENTMPILRDPLTCSKWCVGSDEFPSRKYYPRYCMGFAYIMTIDLVPLLYEQSKCTNFFWVDDVYITGLLPAKVANVAYISSGNAYTTEAGRAMDELQNNRSSFRYLFVHVTEPAMFLSMWQLLLRRASSNYTLSY